MPTHRRPVSTLARVASLALLGAIPSRAAWSQERLALAADRPVAVARDVVYGRADGADLRMDVYRPEGSEAPRLPALIFFNRAFGSEQRSWAFYTLWARAAAARGLVAIVPDLRDGHQRSDFAALVAHLRARGGAHGVDPDAVAVYAASGNARTALPILQSPEVPVQAVVVYYGAGSVARFRPELPILFVRAGLDRPGLNAAMDSLIARALAQNVPVSVINHAGGLHGFEARNADAAKSREAMERTIAFVHSALAPAAQAALRAAAPEATVAGYVRSGDFARAAAGYRELLAARPDDLTLRLSYGEALLGARQFRAACAELAPLRGRGLGARDVGIPGARACAQAGEGGQAIEWLRAIPPRYLPRETRDDPALAPLRGRPEFEALFERR